MRSEDWIVIVMCHPKAKSNSNIICQMATWMCSDMPLTWNSINSTNSVQKQFHFCSCWIYTCFHRKAFSNNSFLEHFTISHFLLFVIFLTRGLPVQSVRVPSSSCSSSTHFCGEAGDFWPKMQRKLSLNVTTSFRAQQQIDCNKIEPKVTIRGGCFRDKINTQDNSPPRPHGQATGTWCEKGTCFQF